MTPDDHRRQCLAALRRELDAGHAPAAVWPMADAMVRAGRLTVEDAAAALGAGRPPDTGPGLVRRTVTFSKALARHVLLGLPRAGDAERNRRLALCQVCDRLDVAKGVCRACGCVVAVKASWAGERCPVGKW